MNEQEFTGAPWALASDGVRGSHTDINCCLKFEKTYLECVCDCAECVEVWLWEKNSGDRVVSVGGGAWCWSAHTAEELAHEILEWLERDTPTKENFYALLNEEIHRTKIQSTEIEFVLNCSKNNGWELYDPEAFLDCINSSYESAGFYNA
jgi:hypothetical protein